MNILEIQISVWNTGGKTGIVSVLAGLWPPASLYRTFNDLVTLATHLSKDEQNATPTAPQSAMQLE